MASPRKSGLVQPPCATVTTLMVIFTAKTNHAAQKVNVHAPIARPVAQDCQLSIPLERLRLESSQTCARPIGAPLANF